MACRIRTLFAATLVPLLAGGAFAQSKQLGKWHNDKKHGFAVRLIDSYSEATPIQPDEEYEIAKFSGPDMPVGKENTIFRTDFRIVRFEPKPPETGSGAPAEATGGKEGDDLPAKPEGKPDLEKLKKEALEARRSRDLKTWLKQASGYAAATVTSEKEVVLPSKVAATELEFTVKTSAKDPSRGYALAAHVPGQEIGLVWVVPENHWDKWTQAFRQCARTFKTIEKEGGTAAGAGGSEIEARIAKIKERSPGWAVEQTPHYLIVSDADKKVLPEVKKRIEAIRGRLEQDYPPEAGKPITAISLLRVCKDKEEYHAYGGPSGSAGYWSDGAEELVIYVDQENPSDTWRTMQHEAFHQYIYYRCGKLAPHSWYNEGTGDYYAGADFNKANGKFEVGIFLWRRDGIRQAIRDGKHVPLAKILRYTQGEYYSNASLCYSQGWSMIYFLREGKKRGAKNWNPAWEKLLPTYFKALVEASAAGKSEEDARKIAIEAALEGVDVDALEKAWMEFTT